MGKSEVDFSQYCFMNRCTNLSVIFYFMVNCKNNTIIKNTISITNNTINIINNTIMNVLKVLTQIWLSKRFCFCNVSATKVDKVVDIALTQISGVQVDGLPKSTFAKDMAIESRGWYSTRLPQGIPGSCTNMTLHSNAGTTKHGRSYTIYGK